MGLVSPTCCLSDFVLVEAIPIVVRVGRENPVFLGDGFVVG